MTPNNCKNRVKPKLLREQKTEALLVFIRTTLEQYFKDLHYDIEEKSVKTIENKDDGTFDIVICD